eukprot:3941816-Rhodomonas_salina.4
MEKKEKRKGGGWKKEKKEKKERKKERKKKQKKRKRTGSVRGVDSARSLWTRSASSLDICTTIPYLVLDMAYLIRHLYHNDI